MTQIMTRVASGKSLRVTLPFCRSGLALGTTILTTDGALPVEFLTPGDKVVTYDRGAMALSKITMRPVPMSELVRIRPSVLQEQGFGRDVLVSARQKVLVKGWRARAMFGKPAALIEARKLVDGDYYTQLTGDAPLRLFQLHFADGRHLVQIGQGLMVASASTKIPVKSKD